MTGTSSENTILADPIWASVKWFDPIKGFGFVVPDDGGADILLHSNVLRHYGRSSIAEHTRLKARLKLTPRGVQVLEVLGIENPQADLKALEDLVTLGTEEIGTIEFEPARVKWFNEIEGYGFANVFMGNEDIFLHAEIIRRSGLGLLESGEAIAVKVIEGQRGLIAVEICSWFDIQKPHNRP